MPVHDGNLRYPCITMLYATTSRGASSAWHYTYTHILKPPFCAAHCIHTNTHYYNHFSSFITPQPPPPASLNPGMSDWWLRQQPSAVRYSQLASPPGCREKKGAYSRIVLIRHCRSVLYHPPHDAARLLEETTKRLTVARCVGQG